MAEQMRVSDEAREIIIEQALEIVKSQPNITMKQLDKIFGIQRKGEHDKHSNFAQWRLRNTGGFRDKYEAALKEAFSNLEGPAITTMADLLKEGSFQAAKYVLDNRNYGATQKISADINADVNITIDIED